MHKSSCSQFFRTTTGIQSGPEVFDESKGVIEMLYGFRLVLEGKTGKEIPKSLRFEFSEKFLTTIWLYQKEKTTPPGR